MIRCYNKFSFLQILVDIGCWPRLTLPIIRNINKLVNFREASIGKLVPSLAAAFKSVEIVVLPLKKGQYLYPTSPLMLKNMMRKTQSNHSHKERLFQIGYLLEANILDHRRQLIMVPNHYNSLDWLFTLHRQRQKCFDFKYLSCFFENDIIVLKIKFNECLSFQGGMCACHCYDSCLLANYIISSFLLISQDFECSALLNFFK